MAARTLAIILIAILALAACDRSGEPQSAAPRPVAESAPPPPPALPDAAPTFVNQVWEVAESRQVARGELRVFLSDGTLVMTSPHATPAFGRWRYEGGRLTIVEEGREYPTDILSLSASAFRIRMNGPGEPVEILFAPAERVSPESLAGAAPTPAATVAQDESALEPVSSSGVLTGTAWRLEGAEATLEFGQEGRASGMGSCNRFNGVVTVEGDAIQFGGIAATRRACPEAVMKQEDAYFAALQDAKRFELDGETLRIYSANRTEPLRFAAGPAPAERPTSSIERAPAGAGTVPTMAGIWTVVGHHMTSASATNDDAARERYGRSLRLTASAAISSGQDCREPRYSMHVEPAEAYLASEYQLARGGLRPFAGRTQIQVLDVACGSAPWSAFGARLLQIDRDRALVPWDGVFFELARDRDFRAVGQEPGWQLELRMGAEMRLTYDYGKSMAVTPAARALVDSTTGTRTFHAVTEANDLRIVIVPAPCTDAMSGRPYPATVSVTLNGRSFRGCGEDLATPFQG